MTKGQFLAKRAFDLVIASALFVLLLPFLAVVALAIRLESPGKILFRQERIGLNGEPFTMYKFRSMFSNVDQEPHHHAVELWMKDPEDREPGTYKIRDDERVTATGRLLRKTSLDELPQLLNVIKGEMSLVGPRPAMPYEVREYAPRHRGRLCVLPGITGMWQTGGWHDVSFEQMVDDDLRYIREWSIGLDVKILLKTIPIVLGARGS